MFIAPTPRAAEAIISHFTRRGDTEGSFCAPLNGVEHEFEARFDVEWERVGYFKRPDFDEASCTLIGAWAYDDNGDVAFAGNRAELVALIGEKAVAQWEEDQAGREMGQ